ncbi:MAG: hypothetical protein ACRD1J_11685 [Terriglobia bacterium]
MILPIIIVIAVLIAAYLLLVFNSVWVYALFDRALKNVRDYLPNSYELPRYFARTPAGTVDTAARWAGWDGWYFFMFPDDRSLPVKMIRASIMTGLYGLDGVDNAQALPPGVSPFDAVEHLVLLPSEVFDPAGGIEKANFLFHRYLPKRRALTMKTGALDVSITGPDPLTSKMSELYGRVEGAWPHYKFNFVQPQAQIAISVSYHAEDIVWWADVPQVFTYFASFGTYEGTLKYVRRLNEEGGAAAPAEEMTAIRGRGGFEHGFSRRPFSFNILWSPLRLITTLIPSFHPVRYHYELLIGDNGLHGGFMLARGFGIDFRNRGGFYLNGKYVPVQSIEVEYIEYESGVAGKQSGKRAAAFPRKWKVRAATTEGFLEYDSVREWPPPAISSNMTYYNFTFSGSYKGQPANGRGYGEYLSI